MTSTDIKRNANGSIDTAYYMALGRQARSDQAYHLAECTRTAARQGFGALREAVQTTVPARQPDPA